MITERLKEEIFEKVREYYRLFHKNRLSEKISYGGRVFNEEEIINLVDSALDFWLTEGKYCNEFRNGLCEFLGVRYCSLTNSGSSANLLAFNALTSPKLGERRIKKGDEIITTALCFPTTISPIIQYGAIPVFVDIELPYYNIDCSYLEEALSDKTKAVIIAHTLGNPFDVEKIKDFCERHSLWLIEDNCDALGSRYFYKGDWRYTGTFGDISTLSFYPAHHITTGEGGALFTNDPILKRIIDSFRDWGRDCWCPPGKDNSCQRRFDWKLGELPYGYDHKYIYSHFGFNLRMTEMQAAIGCAQLKKLPSFIEQRKKNWHLLKESLKELSDYFILPEESPNSDPSWFGFALTIRDESKLSRNDLIRYLESNGIQTRLLFSGNIIRHPCFDEMRKEKKGFKVIGDLKNTDKVMRDTFWLGVYPGLNKDQLLFIAEKIKRFVKGEIS